MLGILNILSLILIMILTGKFYCPYFSDKKREAPTHKVICHWSHAAINGA